LEVAHHWFELADYLLLVVVVVVHLEVFLKILVLPEPVLLLFLLCHHLLQWGPLGLLLLEVDLVEVALQVLLEPETVSLVLLE
jgi:hypothetical protein